MLKIVIASALIASVAAHRIQIDAKSQSKFGASCEDLQTTFHNRVVAVQTLLDAHPDSENMSRATQVRAMMRSFQCVRTLRRARTCAWVVDGDSAEIEQIRTIVQAMLAGNPCAEAARAELQAGASGEIEEMEMESVQRAMSVLLSDSCEVPLTPDESVELAVDDQTAMDVQLTEIEAQAQDAIDDLVDASEADSDSAAGSAFVHVGSDAQWPSFRSMMRSLGVAFLLILLLLACTSAVVYIGAMIGAALFMIFGGSCSGGNNCIGHGYAALGAMMLGGMGGGLVGLAGCSYTLYNQLLSAPAAQSNSSVL